MDQKALGHEDKDRGQNTAPLNVPIPSQLPPKPNLEDIPTHVVRSGAVESLIQQNEDLMARLSVSLRRIASLEENFSETNKENHKLKKKYENLKDQVLILREKTNAIAERHKDEDGNLVKLKNEIRLREMEFAEFYSSSKSRQSQLLNKIDSLSRRISRFLKYRSKTQKVVKEFKSLQTERLREKEALLGSIEQDRDKLERELNQEIESNSRLKTQVQESSEHIQVQSKQFRQDQQKNSRSYEDKLSESLKMARSLEIRIQELENKNLENEGLYEKNVELENKLVLTERQKTEMHERHSAEISELQKNLAQYRTESKTKTLELETKNQDLVRTHNELMKLKTSHEQSVEQVENLQCLWRENNAQLEKQKEKNKALQKLNQQLSLKMNEYRQEIFDLKSQLESVQILTTQKFKELKGQVKAVTEIKAQEELAANPDGQADPEFNPDLMNKIDFLIDEIHSAFNSQPQISSNSKEESAEVPPPA